MAKACIKKDLQQLGNEIDDLIMLEDSARGTLCAIHKTIHSTDNFPCSRHEMIKICPMFKSCNVKPTRIPVRRSRKKSRSSSPCNDNSKMCRALSAHDPYREHFCPKPPIYCRIERKKPANPNFCNTEYVNVEKTISCPEKMCCHTPHNTYSVTSRSSVQIDQFARNLINTDEIVNELKGEIAKVKHQIHHLSHQKISEASKTKIPCLVRIPSSNQGDPEESQIAKLKNENKRLKREVEAKKKLLEKSRNDVTKAKDILADYEKKVNLLHVQVLKSSKAMKLSKEKFCNCLKDKEEKIKSLEDSHKALVKLRKEKENLLDQKEVELKLSNENVDNLKKALKETSEKCSTLTETNQNLYESIDLMRNQLLNSSTEINSQKETIEMLERKICDLNCICKKVVSKTRKQKESYESIIKNNEEEQLKITKEISELSSKLEETERQKSSIDELRCKCQELEKKLKEYEKYSDKCKILEEECKNKYDLIVASQNSFEKDKQEMEKLIAELTTVATENKITLAQMSEINKQQEKVIKNQSMALLTKEEQLQLVEKESEDFKTKNRNLEQEIEGLKKALSEPCTKEACLCISKELDQIRNALNFEKDNHLLKEKIIQDQSQTILDLQNQVKEKISKLSKAEDDTKYLEEEINRINEKLIQKHEELDMEIDEKENLIEKLRILECQKNQLLEEISDFEEMLHHFKETCGDNQKQQKILRNLESQIAEQKREWNMQKETIVNEKQKAVCAAKFATQKLMDTVQDFQRQVDAQKKVQLLLTKMLHEKDEQLRTVKSKISNINNITKDVAEGNEISMKELFFHKTLETDFRSDPNTNTSIYSSCSSCCKRPDGLSRPTNLSRTEMDSDLGSLKPLYSNKDATFLSSIQKIQEEPSRDLS